MQVAHSLREILHKFEGKGGFEKNFIEYGSTHNKSRIGADAGIYHNFIRDVAHHNFEEAERSLLIGGSSYKPVTLTDELFENVVLRFGKILFAILRRQLEAHGEIDNIVTSGPGEYCSNMVQQNQSVQDIEKIRELINLNPDSYHYFFAKADERWLGWLWDNGFLDAVKQKAENPTRYSLLVGSIL